MAPISIRSLPIASAQLQDGEPDQKKVARDWVPHNANTHIALGNILFAKAIVTSRPEMLFEEAIQTKVSVSLATVYNTLHPIYRGRPFATGRNRFFEILF